MINKAKTIHVFNTPMGLIVVIALKSHKQPELPVAAAPAASAWHQSKSIPRPVTMGKLEPFVKSGEIK